MLVFPLPRTSHANPKRGAQSFLSGKLAPLGAPASSGKTSPLGAPGHRVDCSAGMKEKLRPRVSYFGCAYSYRRPKFNVSRFVTPHWSCAYPAYDVERMFEGAFGNCVHPSGSP